jgi:deoxycytidylate deaminase
MNREARIVNRLVNIADGSTMCFRHSAALVKGGKVYSIGKNSDRACINGNAVTSTHAEVDAILNSLKMGIVPSGDIWVIRYQRSGVLGKSRPCSSCLKVIRQFNIARIFYSWDDGEIIKVKTSEFKSDWMSGAQKSHGVNNIVLC